jgi:hypothetical protein
VWGDEQNKFSNADRVFKVKWTILPVDECLPEDVCELSGGMEWYGHWSRQSTRADIEAMRKDGTIRIATIKISIDVGRFGTTDHITNNNNKQYY